MKAMKCDVCGKLYETYSGEKVFPNTTKSNTIAFIDKTSDWRGCWSYGKKDLCPACMMAVIDLLARLSANGKEESSNVSN